MSSEASFFGRKLLTSRNSDGASLGKYKSKASFIQKVE